MITDLPPSREEGSSEGLEERVYEKIYELETEEVITPVSTDPSVTSPVAETDGAELDRQDSSLSADELAAVRAKFYRLAELLGCLVGSDNIPAV